MDSRANMRAMLESARQSIRNRAANADGAAVKAKAATIVSSGHSRKPTESRLAEVAEGLHFQKDTTSGAEGAAEANSLNAKDNQMQFVQHYYRLICAFIEDKSKYELELPNLSALDRVVVHALAEKCNLSHESAGARAERVLHLKKDILFFQHPEAAQQVNLDEVVEKIAWKESKYQIRYVRSANPAQVAVGDIGSYADEEALHKIERFRRATDEYRHATDMGYTQQELLLAEAGKQGGGDDEDREEEFGVPTNVEEILSRPDPSTPAITAGPVTISAPLVVSSTPTSTAARAMKAAAQTTAAKSATTSTTTVFDEVCRHCGSRVRLDGPPQGWKCSHYCAHCSRQTIWSLEEVKTQEVRPTSLHGSAPKRSRDDAGAEREEVLRKRAHGDHSVEAIDCDNDDEVVGNANADGGASAEAFPDGDSVSDNDDDDDGNLTVEDIAEMAATNDFSAKDVNWLREFTSRPNAQPGRQVAFCIDFSDLTEMPIFSRYTAAKGTDNVAEEAKVWYVVLREVRELSLTVSDLLRELMSEVFADLSTAQGVGAVAPAVEEIQTEDDEQRAMEHLGVAFPNLSVYGTECVAVCQLRPVVRRASLPKMIIKTHALKELRQRYGERHVFASLSLDEAVAHAASSNNSA